MNRCFRNMLIFKELSVIVGKRLNDLGCPADLRTMEVSESGSLYFIIDGETDILILFQCAELQSAFREEPESLIHPVVLDRSTAYENTGTCCESTDVVAGYKIQKRVFRLRVMF